ncbi:hypothetical protein PAMP_023918 [Pampus punctatissimus]
MAPRLISGTQRPQTEVAEDTQWEQGLKAWFTSVPREGVREVERQGEREDPTQWGPGVGRSSAYCNLHCSISCSDQDATYTSSAGDADCVEPIGSDGEDTDITHTVNESSLSVV